MNCSFDLTCCCWHNTNKADLLLPWQWLGCYLWAAGFFLQFILEMSCFYTRMHCVTHKINALDDFVKTVRPAVWAISLCCCSLRHSAARVVPCSHVGFKHRMRAGAAIVQVHWRGNKHKQRVLSCLEVSLVPMDVLLCRHSVLCSTRQQPKS